MCNDIVLFLSFSVQWHLLKSEDKIVHMICVKSLHDINVPFTRSSEICCNIMHFCGVSKPNETIGI